jgi:hypothetical protein
LRARQYDPAVGRFISRDPVLGSVSDPQSQHAYAYAHGDPVNLTDPTGMFTLMDIAAAIGIQNVLRGVDLGRHAVQTCTLTGKIEVAQEALFWGQFAVAGPLILAELVGSNTPNTKTEFAIAAKRYLNVLKSPDKIVEASAGIEFSRLPDTETGEKDLTLSAEFIREDTVKFGGSLVLNNLPKSKFTLGAGAATVSFGGGGGPELGLEKEIEIFKAQRCGITIVEGALKLGGSVSLEGPKLSADIVLKGLAGLVKFTYPLIPELK